MLNMCVCTCIMYMQITTGSALTTQSNLASFKGRTATTSYFKQPIEQSYSGGAHLHSDSSACKRSLAALYGKCW